MVSQTTFENKGDPTYDGLATYWATRNTQDTGDFNGDLTADIFDLDILAANWVAGAVPAAVPEPTVLLLLTLGGLALIRRRS